MEVVMEIWALAFIAGWCGTGAGRLPEWLIRLIRKLPPPPDPDPWPIIHPWGAISPILYGVLGGVGGVAAWALAGARFGSDTIWPVVVIGILGGGVGLSIADTLAGMSSRGPNVRG